MRSISLVCLLAAFSPLAEAQSAYQGTINTWVAQDSLNPPPAHSVLFVGSSSIRRWERLALDFAHYDVIQRGFGGSQFSDLNQFVNDIVLPYDPAAIVVFEGTNDIAAGKSPAQVFQDYLTFVDLVHSGQSPGRRPIPILFIGITPTPARWSIWPRQAEVNALVETRALTSPFLHYIDVPGPFLATGMPPSSSLFVSDGLHLNQAGYDLWTTIIRPALEAVCGSFKRIPSNAAHPASGAALRVDFGPSNREDGNHTTSPGPFGKHWNNWHQVAGGSATNAGESLGNLVTTAGASSGIDLLISAGFNCNGILNGGLLNPSQALLGNFAVPTATQDYFFSDNLDSGGGFYLTGLDPQRNYELRFFATRNTSEVRITRYHVFGGAAPVSGDLQTSGPGIGNKGVTNGNDDTILTFSQVVPDAFGQLFIDVEKVAGAFAYVGIFELIVR